MKQVIIDMKDLSDSVEVYDSRPNPFLVYTIYTILAVVVVAVIWASFFKLDDVVKSNGIFKTTDSIYSVSSDITGKITECKVENGSFVNAGDILYVVSIDSLEDTIKSYQSVLDNSNARLEMLEAYETALEDNRPILDKYKENRYYEEFVDRRELLLANLEFAAESNIAILNEKMNVYNEKLNLEDKITECENYLKSYNIKEENCNIVATASGYYYCNQELKQGSYIQESTTIGHIYPEKETEFYAEIYVENSDIGRIQEGQNVKFEVSAFPASEYGYLTGTVNNISKDITVDNNTGSAYYIVKVKCNNFNLKNKDGENAALKNGMACQGKIVIGEKTVMRYILSKINLY